MFVFCQSILTAPQNDKILSKVYNLNPDLVSVSIVENAFCLASCNVIVRKNNLNTLVIEGDSYKNNILTVVDEDQNNIGDKNKIEKYVIQNKYPLRNCLSAEKAAINISVNTDSKITIAKFSQNHTFNYFNDYSFARSFFKTSRDTVTSVGFKQGEIEFYEINADAKGTQKSVFILE